MMIKSDRVQHGALREVLLHSLSRERNGNFNWDLVRVTKSRRASEAESECPRVRRWVDMPVVLLRNRFFCPRAISPDFVCYCCCRAEGKKRKNKFGHGQKVGKKKDLTGFVAAFVISYRNTFKDVGLRFLS